MLFTISLVFRATAEDCLDSSYFKEQPYREFSFYFEFLCGMFS